LERLLIQRSEPSSSQNFANQPSDQSPMSIAPATPSAPIVTSPSATSLRAVKLSNRINYLHCEGGHGVITFTSKAGVPLFVKEVETQEDFRLNFSVFSMMETLV